MARSNKKVSSALPPIPIDIVVLHPPPHASIDIGVLGPPYIMGVKNLLNVLLNGSLQLLRHNMIVKIRILF